MSEHHTSTDDDPLAHLDASTQLSQDASPTPPNNQLDHNDLSTTFDKLQITEPTTQPTAVPIHDYAPDDEEVIEYESDESWDYDYHIHRMSKRDIRLYEERRVLERQEPIQAHLEALHQAFWNVDPEYTVFAVGGTIPQEEISCEELVLRVWKDVSGKELDANDIKDEGGGTNKQEEEINPSKASKAGEQVGQSGDIQEAEFRFPLIGEQVDKLLEYATTAPFGKGNETVVDPYYRKAMEITPDRFTLEPNPILDTEGILNKIAGTLHMKCKLRTEMAKLNIYTKGGFFRKHCDTPRSPEHIGTIVLGLPGAYYGGGLQVKHGGPEVDFRWGTSYHEYKEKGLLPSTEIQWAFLYGDCEHQVWSVDHGARLTVAYDVFTVPDFERDAVEETTNQSEDIYQALQIALANHEGFAKDGCTLAFGLSHSYPKTTKALMGRAAFHREEDPNGHWDHYDPAREWGKAQMDNLSATTLNAIYRNDLDRYQVILTDKPDAVEGCYHWNINGDQDFFEDLDRDLPVIKQLVWVDLPQSYGFRNDYYYIGNGPCDPDEAYSGVVMLIEIPPADQR